MICVNTYLSIPLFACMTLALCQAPAQKLLFEKLPEPVLGCIIILLNASPIVNWFIALHKLRDKKPTGLSFEWSYYGAVLSMITVEICILVGLHWSLLSPFFLCIFLAFLVLPIFAARICPSYKFSLKVNNPYLTKLDILIIITYFITTTLIIYHFPFNTPNLIPPEPQECQNPWICFRGGLKFIPTLRACIFFSIIPTIFIISDALILWRTQKLIFEEYMDSGVKRKQILIRKGWNWVVDDGPMEHLEDFRHLEALSQK